MCRLVTFAGSCTRCGESYTWHELTQELSCLEAKNNDCFGSCSSGVEEAEHALDQECDGCEGEDEGVADVEGGEGEDKRKVLVNNV
ncbi:hypothetical protein SLS62_010201 [Diatrype stigma]|uniref:Uncharacterized protein n=1 Tax=Diatrype stigma TaxID=117547 RepID=A0AAN9YHQ3_9PEZI